MNIFGSNARHGALALALLLSACTSPSPNKDAMGASDAARQALACTLPTNCVDSLSGGQMPLQYTGTPAQAMATLQATLAMFPEARIVRSEYLALETIFTTPAGFQDEVEFRIDAAAQRIDFRSRSLFGLFDFGKNRSRMRAFAARFEQQQGR